jgi:phospholipase C
VTHWVAPGIKGGTSVSTTNYNWTWQHPRFVADLTGDGRADIVGIGADGVWSSLNQGDAGFTAPTFRLVAFEANAGWRIADHPRFLVDLTGNGRADLLGFGDAGPWTALGNGDGSFGEFRLVLTELGFTQGWSAEYPRFLADLTGDGRPDLIGFGMDGIWVALSNGDGTFQPARLVSGDLAFNSGWRVANHPRFVIDLTGDGRADVLGFGDDGAWVTRGNGDGSFQPAQFVLQELGFNQGWRVDSHPRFVVDLTGDGRSDIVGFGNDGVWVALGNGDGSFQSARFVLGELGFNQGWRVDKHPRFVTDLTGDGRADIVGFGDDGVWVALGNGDGTFQPARFILANLGANAGWRVEDHPRFLADVTGDGRPDLVGFGTDGMWVARNNGDGSFQEARFVLADFGRQSNHDTIVRREVVRDHRNRGRIKHFFVLMLENRSYDHLLGFADLSGVDAASGTPTKADGVLPATAEGVSEKYFNTFHNQKHGAVRGAPDVTVSPGHHFSAALEQLCGPDAKYPPGGPYPDVNNTGFVYSLKNPDIMRCFHPDHLRILTTLAQEFAVCDRWFCSMPGPTEPNRFFLHAATSGDYDDSPSPEKIAEASTNHFGGFDFEGGNIFDALEKAGVKTRIYAGDHFPVVGELEGISNTFDVREFEELAEDLRDRSFEAGFIHIEPKYFAGLTDLGDFGGGNSQHPSGGIAAGERLIKGTYEAIRNSPHWESSMLVITYDEHGGFYDHVAPGSAARTGSKGDDHGFVFDQLGPRVPSVVISPLIPKNTIEHRLLEHCSVLKTACDLFDVPHLKHARDLRDVCGLAHLASLSAPRTDAPTRLPDVVVSPLPAAPAGDGGHHNIRRVNIGGRHLGNVRTVPIPDNQESFLATTLRVAAVRNMALEPQRKREIVARVTQISTEVQAVAFIKEVEAKLAAARPH